MEVWLPRITSRIGQTSTLVYSERLIADEGNRLNVHLAEDGTVRHVDFK